MNPASVEAITFAKFRQVDKPPSGVPKKHVAAAMDCQISVDNARVADRSEHFLVESVDVVARVNWSGCWVVKKLQSAALLEHERLHFLLMACVGRQLHDRLLATRAASRSSLMTKLKKAMSTHQRRASDLTDQYDKDTDHGAIVGEQARWKNRIRSWYSAGKLVHARSGQQLIQAA